MTNPANVITLKDLRKVFQTDEVETHALSEVHLSIARGEYVSISGPSGCGKTTLLSILGLLDTASSGSYVLNGHDVAALNAFVQQVRPDIVARSGFELEGDFVDAQVLSYDMPRADQIVIIETDAANALVAFPVDLTLAIDATFGFFSYNADAEEWVGLGSSEERVEHQASVRVVARVPRDLHEDDRAAEIRVEAPTRFAVHFGDTRPDFGRD